MTYRCVSRTMHARGSLRAFAPTPVLSGRDRQRPALKLLQKGSHRRGGLPTFRQSSFPRSRGPPSSPPTPKNPGQTAGFLHIYIYIYAFTLKFFLPGIARPRILLFRDIGGAVNVLVDDPIVGKLEESPRVFPRGENNVVVASLERNNRSQTDFLRTYRGTESVRDRHTLHLSKLIVISLNRELFLRVKFPFVLRTAYYGQVLYTFHIHVTFASRNDSWTVWWVKEGLK